ncbi:MAG: phospholipase [Acidobacteria bacterium]|nr:MAG: phospholipase [Acidobacteriota bacterium]
MIERTIAASTHGRYVVAPSSSAGPSPLLVGFHGYAESAEMHLERLRAIPGAARWLIVSVQGLHRFYRGRSQDVVASWMTRQDRELAVADNVGYVASVVDQVSREWAAGQPLIFAGFSQGVATTFRAAAASTTGVSGIVALGGDVPPDLDQPALARIPAALIGRGADDEWYSPAKFAEDLQRLTAAGVDVRPIEFDGGHEWSADFNRAAGEFLRQWR